MRGDQVSGEYAGKASDRDDGWFPTRDGGWIDEGGYLFVEGRLDDVIVRGGENISPGEIEDVIRTYPGVADVAVVGIPSQEWGEDIVAFVVTTGEAPDERGDPGLRARAAALVEGPGPRRVPRRAALQRDRQAAAPRPQGRSRTGRQLTKVRPCCAGGAAAARSAAAGGAAAASAGGPSSPR